MAQAHGSHVVSVYDHDAGRLVNVRIDVVVDTAVIAQAIAARSYRASGGAAVALNNGVIARIDLTCLTASLQPYKVVVEPITIEANSNENSGLFCD